MMELRIDNIGIVKESEIKLNGITAITGHNNSGKTTVSKALYSIVSSVEDLSASILKEKNSAVANFVENVTGEVMLRLYENKEDYETIRDIRQKVYGRVQQDKDVVVFLEYLQDSFKELFNDVVNKTRKDNQKEFYIDLYHSVNERFLTFREKLQKDFEPVNYVNGKLNDILFAEFNHQILPVNCEVPYGQIQLFEEEKKIIDVFVNRDSIRKRKETFSMSLFNKKVIFVDDVYVLDDLITKVEKKEKLPFLVQNTRQNIIDNNAESHKEKLMNKLWQKSDRIYSSILSKEVSEKIYARLEDVFDDKVVLDSGKLVCANSKIHVGNLAMGAKVFALLKMLLDNGAITRDTILILDEPEVHLHPEWQNVLAELLVLIMQEVNATILLTTHSSQFLMALETYIKKYKHYDRFKVYSTERLDDKRFVRYVDRTESIKDAYYKLAKPMFDIKVLKDSIEE